MARQPKHNVVEEKTSGYITRKKLEAFLQERYPNVSSIDEFDIKEKRDKWEFYAPDEIPEESWR